MPRKTERLYTDGDGLELRPPLFARTMPKKTVLHMHFVHVHVHSCSCSCPRRTALLPRTAPRLCGVALATGACSSLAVRPTPLCPPTSRCARAKRSLIGGDLALVEPEAVEEAVHPYAVLRLHARRGSSRRLIRVRLLLRYGGRSRHGRRWCSYITRGVGTRWAHSAGRVQELPQRERQDG